jgi:predicted permease
VVGQVALAMIVLVTAALFVRSLQIAIHVDPGFEANRVLIAAIDLRDLKTTPVSRETIFATVSRRIALLPGVQSVSLADSLPLGSTQRTADISSGLARLPTVASARVDRAYLRTMGIPLVRGNDFSVQDESAAIVNEALAVQMWPSQDPVGQPIRVKGESAMRKVVGLVRTAKYWSLDETPRPFIYLLSNRSDETMLFLVTRTAGPANRFPELVRRSLQQFDADLPPGKITTANEALSDWLAPTREAAQLLSILGLMALGLATVGLYGLMAQLITQRTPEIAVRMALGAGRWNVIAMVLRQTMIFLGAGITLGTAGALATSRLIQSLVIRVSSADQSAFTAAAALVILIGAMAVVVPAYRAGKLNPTTVLRSD